MHDMEEAIREQNLKLETAINMRAVRPQQGDFLQKPLPQKEQVYNFIKSRGRVLTHELNEFGVKAFINDAQTRARELARDGRIWRMKEDIKKIVFGYEAKDEAWSIFEADR